MLIWAQCGITWVPFRVPLENLVCNPWLNLPVCVSQFGESSRFILFISTEVNTVAVIFISLSDRCHHPTVGHDPKHNAEKLIVEYHWCDTDFMTSFDNTLCLQYWNYFWKVLQSNIWSVYFWVVWWHSDVLGPVGCPQLHLGFLPCALDHCFASISLCNCASLHPGRLLLLLLPVVLSLHPPAPRCPSVLQLLPSQSRKPSHWTWTSITAATELNGAAAITMATSLLMLPLKSSSTGWLSRLQCFLRW